MKNKIDQETSPQVSDQLHPFVHVALAGLSFCLVLSAWIFFSQGGYLELNLGVVSALFFMITAIPTLLYLLGRKPVDRGGRAGRSWRAWISGDFDTKQGRRTAFSASVEILLPMTAAVIGSIGIGIVFHLTEVGSSWL
jgi:hypothetical protein